MAVDIDGVRQGQDVVKRPRLANQLQALMVADAVGDVVVATGLRFMVRYAAGNNSWKVTLPAVANLLSKAGRQRLTDFTYGASAMLCLRLGRQHRPVLWARARDAFGSRKEMRTALAAMMQKGHRRTERRINAEIGKARGQHKAALTRLRKMGWLKRTLSKRGRQARATLELWKKRERNALRERRQFEALAPFLTCW